jgi:MoaA/NifB/PqqE/SkfB family radical SAM enzyme
MKKLEDIGFYTLCDKRAKETSTESPLWRNELIITSACNFKCPYCRGTTIDGEKKHMSIEDVKNIVDMWASHKIQNVRFSGGEPTLHPDIKEIIRYTKEKCDDIKHIAISTNGYSSYDTYKELHELGVNDFSISLDACCSSVGDMMSGGVEGSWNIVVENIKKLSKLTYVTVGMVFSEENANQMKESIEFADGLGVSDIRIITAAQWNNFDVFKTLEISEEILNRHPILKYRIENFRTGRNVRGIEKGDCTRCWLMMDDMVIKGDAHYPCVIHMREHGAKIGTVKGKTMTEIRNERLAFILKHDTSKDALCRKNCLDVCIDYNNKVKDYKK